MIPMNQEHGADAPRSPRMFSRHTRNTRTAATLVELLVVMAVITALGALALMVLPSVANQDNTLKGTADVQGTLKMAQSMAGVSRLPRGVRFIVNPATGLSTEMQYLEAPPVLVPDPQVLVAKSSDPTGLNTRFGPRVEINYTVTPNAPPPGATATPPNGALPGTIYFRQCIVRGLTLDQAAQVVYGSTIVLPTLNAWSKILSATQVTPSVPGTFDLDIALEVFPDAQMGAGTNFLTYHFGIYGPPVPLIGEPTVLLPKGIAVDLNNSTPVNLSSVGTPVDLSGNPLTAYDVLFAPGGQLLYTPGNPALTQNTAVFLWVRDITKDDKLPNGMRPASRNPWMFDPAQRQFQLGGEQQIVGIRNGFIGTAPVLWPNLAGSYSGTDDPYSSARLKLN